MQKKIILVGGGTGGHFFCVKAVQEQLSKSDIYSIVVTDRRCAKFSYDQDHLIDFTVVKTTMINKNLWKTFLSCMYIFFHLIKFIILFIRVKPCLVVGFGGYTSFAVLLSALILKIPIVLHEQNVVLGKVNRIFARKAKKVIFTLDSDKNYFLEKEKIALCEPPIRQQIKDLYLHKKHLLTDNSSEDFVIFVTGGSAGAAVFVKLMQIVFNQLIKLNVDLTQISIIHQCPDIYIEEVQNFYNSIRLKSCIVKSFFYDIEKYYAISSLVIARAGAGTISEILFLKKPAILIPLPTSAHDHQNKNAKYLEDSGLAWCVFEHNLLSESAPKVVEITNYCISNKSYLLNKLNALHARSQSKRIQIYQEIINVISSK